VGYTWAIWSLFNKHRQAYKNILVELSIITRFLLVKSPFPQFVLNQPLHCCIGTAMTPKASRQRYRSRRSFSERLTNDSDIHVCIIISCVRQQLQYMTLIIRNDNKSMNNWSRRWRYLGSMASGGSSQKI